MARTVDMIGGPRAPSATNVPTTTPNPFSNIPVSAFTSGSLSTGVDIALRSAAADWMSGIHGVGSGSEGLSNFNLNKSVNLKDIDLQKKELLREQAAGLRDIGQSRVEGLRAAVNNALSRGIFRSGIRERNEALVERESGEASGDLQERIGIALERLANRRRGVAGQKFSGGSSGGTSGSGLTSSDMQLLFSALYELIGGSGRGGDNAES